MVAACLWRWKDTSDEVLKKSGSIEERLFSLVTK